MHLSADELVDLAEGARPASSAPHLATCGRCRAQLNDLRAMMSVVAAVDVPEPSPLFWDHLSQRVHDAVAAEEADARGAARLKGSRFIVAGIRAFALGLVGARAFQASVVAVTAAALLIFVVLPSRMLSPANPPRVGVDGTQPPLAEAAARDLWADVATDSDPSLTLVANLTAALDADGTSEARLARVGSAEHAVTHLNDADLRELQRLLQEEMAP